MKKKMTNKDKTFWAIVIPVLLLFFAFNTFPMIKGIIYSFTNYRGYGTYDFVGIRNYLDLFGDARVGKSYLFTFKYALAGTVLVNVLSLIWKLCRCAEAYYNQNKDKFAFLKNIQIDF